MELHPASGERPAVNIEALVGAASRIAGFDVSPGDAALVLTGLPLDDLWAEQSNRIQWAIWDKETPINGVAPERVLARADYAGGEIYLIYIDGQLVFLQPHRPDAADPVEADEAHEIAATHAAELVEEQFMHHLVTQIASQATPPSPTVSMDDLRELLGRRGGQ